MTTSNSRNIKIGSDPEMFVIRNGAIAHCIGLLGGDKENPRKVHLGAVQEDNVLFEYNTEPTSIVEDFKNSIQLVKEQGLEILGSEYSFSTASSHIFTPQELALMPESAFEFGCSPDYNALTGNQNPRPAAADPGLRSAGGHIHIGWDHLCESDKSLNMTDGFKRKIIVMADYFLGLPLTIEDPDTRRQELYGKAGACRLKSYGAEYRTPSNFWTHSVAMQEFVFSQTKKIMDMHEQFAEMTSKVSPVDIQNAINSGNKKLMEAYMKTLKIA